MIVTNNLEEIRSVYGEWKKAIIGQDIAKLDLLYTEDFIFSRSGSRDKNKHDVLYHYNSQTVEYLNWQDENPEIEIGKARASFQTSQVIKMIIYELPVTLERKLLLKFIQLNNHSTIDHIIETKLQ